MKHNLVTAYKSEKGKRPSNEDSCIILCAEELGDTDAMLVVADGMGGRASGEVASRIAVDSVRDVFLSEQAAKDLNPIETLARGFRTANDAVFRKGSSAPNLEGMGTTCVTAAVKEGQAFYANIGDSRAYLLRDENITQLTEDHSLVAEKVKSGEISQDEARKSRFRNIITRAIGLEPDVHPDTGSIDLQTGDLLLLCTDGLTGPVSDTEIADIIRTSADTDEACSKLISTALKNGGTDNITVAIAAYGSISRSVGKKPKTGKSIVSQLLSLLIGLLVGIALGLYPVRTLVEDWKAKPSAETIRQESTVEISAYQDPVTLINKPIGDSVLAVDGNGYVLVADTQGQLLRVDSVRRVVYPIPSKDIIKPSSGPKSPYVAVDKQGNLFISDPRQMRIAEYTRSGLLMRGIAKGKLLNPGLISIGSDGSIYVIDSGYLKVIRPNINE